MLGTFCEMSPQVRNYLQDYSYRRARYITPKRTHNFCSYVAVLLGSVIFTRDYHRCESTDKAKRCLHPVTTVICSIFQGCIVIGQGGMAIN